MNCILGKLVSIAISSILAFSVFVGCSFEANAQIPSLPENLSPVNGSQIAATPAVGLQWNAVPNASSYNVRANNWSNGALRAPGNNCPGDPHYLCVNDLTSTSISMPVDAGSSYGFWLNACNANGCSDVAVSNFSVLAAAPPPTPPIAPSSLSPSGMVASGTTTVQLSWNYDPNVTVYYVRANDNTDSAVRYSGNTCPGSPHYFCIDGVSLNSISMPVSAGHSYGWWLNACNSAGCSNVSTEYFTVPAAAPPPEPCIPSGNGASIQYVLDNGGVNAKAVLCQFSTFSLSSKIWFRAENQEIYTVGLPTNDAAKALLRIDDPNQQVAVEGVNLSGVKLRNVKVDGGRLPSTATAVDPLPLISMGGDAVGQVVEHVRAWEPKGWTVLHFFEGAGKLCSNATISSNAIGPSGWPGRSGWADGISLACRNSTVSNNTITDATDGGIVVFGAPGSLISFNTIVASSRKLLGGINMVDYAPFDGDYTGTVVDNNTVNASGAQIVIGIAMGPRAWAIASGTWNVSSLRNGTVTNNKLIGNSMGYGFTASGVTNWNVSGNTSSALHSGLPDQYHPTVAFPSKFQRNCDNTTGNFQPGFSTGNLTDLLGLGGPTSGVAPAYSPRDLSPACPDLPQTNMVTLIWTPSPEATQYFVRAYDYSAPSSRAPGNNCSGDPQLYLCRDGVIGTSITMPVTPGHVYVWWIHAATWTTIGDPPAVAYFSVKATP